MSGPMHDRGGYEDRETLRAQIGALTDELDRLRERLSSHPHDIAMLERRLADARSDARTTAANNERLAATLREAGFWKHTLILVGPALEAGGTRSHLYHPGHFHTFRKPDKAARQALRAARAAARPAP